MATKREMKELAEGLKSKNSGFDTSIYKPNQLWRLPDSYKYQQDKVSHRKPIIENGSLEDFIVQDITNISESLTIPKKIDISPVVKPKILPIYNNIDTDEILNKILENGNNEYLENADLWYKVISYYYAYTDGKGLDAFINWSKKSNKYNTEYYIENNIKIWNNWKNDMTQDKGLMKLKQLSNTMDVIDELDLVFTNTTDDKIAQHHIHKYGHLWKVIDQKTIYYFNTSNLLWKEVGKQKFASFGIEHYNKDLNLLLDRVEKECESYKSTEIPETLKTQKKQIKRMMNNSGKQAIIPIFFSHTEIQDEDFINKLNSNKDYLPVKNGKVNLKTGKWSLRTTDDCYTYEIKTEYNEDAEDPAEFISFLRQLFEVDKYENEVDDIVEYLQVYLGYCLTGNTHDEKALFLYGEGGNGKSKLMSILSDILETSADNHITRINSNLFNSDAGLSNANQATPEIAKLLGVRMCCVDEGDSMVLNQTFKELVSKGVKITARNLYKNSLEFNNMAKFIFCVNEFPKFPVEECFTRRINCLGMMARFTDKPEGINDKLRDTHINEKVMGTEKKKTEILRWLVKGAMKWYENGNKIYDLPPKAKDIMNNYIKKNDPLECFVFTNCQQDYIPIKQLYEYTNLAGKGKLVQDQLIEIIENKSGFKKKRKTIPQRDIGISKYHNGKIVCVFGIKPKIEDMEDEKECWVQAESQESSLDCK